MKNSIDSFVYFTNYVLRNVVTVRSVGHIFSDVSIERWLEKNGFSKIFVITSSQVSKIDDNFLSKCQNDFVIGFDPFGGLDQESIPRCLETIDTGTSGFLIGVKTTENHDIRPKTMFTNARWSLILSQICPVVRIYERSEYSLFLGLKNGTRNEKNKFLLPSLR